MEILIATALQALGIWGAAKVATAWRARKAVPVPPSVPVTEPKP